MPRKLLAGVQTLCTMIVVFVLMALALEGIAHFLHVPSAAPWVERGKDLRLGLEPQDPGYAECLKENDAWNDDIANVHFEPYTYWLSGAYAGKCIHIDEGGVRRGYEAPHAEGAKRTRIWLFGGSTMWGWGNRDEDTIPSQRARVLEEARFPAEVKNYGEDGYVSTQELIRYLRAVGRTGEAPDVVVFMDGLNDIETALVRRRAGETWVEGRLADSFRMNHDNAFMLKNVFLNTRLYALLTAKRWPPMPAISAERTEELAADIVRRYAANVAAAEGIAAAGNTRALFYLQPFISAKKQLTPFEASSREWDLPGANNKALFLAVAAHARRALAGDPRFHAIDDLFADHAETVFTDYRHYTPAGNLAIAKRIASDILAGAKHAE